MLTDPHVRLEKRSTIVPAGRARLRTALGNIRRAPLCLVLLALVPLVAACGSGNVKTYRATVKVICDGTPAPFAFVILHPSEGNEQLQKLRPNGRADRDGVVRFTTYQTEDGAPAGKYRVTVKCPGAPPGQRWEDMAEEAKISGPDRCGGRYQDPNTSGLSLEVTSASELPPLEVIQTPAARR